MTVKEPLDQWVRVSIAQVLIGQFLQSIDEGLFLAGGFYCIIISFVFKAAGDVIGKRSKNQSYNCTQQNKQRKCGDLCNRLKTENPDQAGIK